MPATGDIYQFDFIQLLKLQILETVIHMRARTGLVTEDAIKASATNFLQTLAKGQCTEVTYPQVRVKRMTPLAFDQFLFAPPGINSGLINESPQNNQISLIFTKRTGVAGLRHRGRMFVGGFPIGWGVNQLLSGTPATTAGTMAGEFLAKFGEDGTDATFAAGVYSKEIGGTIPFTVAGWQAITRWDPQLTFGVQRKRKLGVGI